MTRQRVGWKPTHYMPLAEGETHLFPSVKGWWKPAFKNNPCICFSSSFCFFYVLKNFEFFFEFFFLALTSKQILCIFFSLFYFMFRQYCSICQKKKKKIFYEPQRKYFVGSHLMRFSIFTFSKAILKIQNIFFSFWVDI